MFQRVVLHYAKGIESGATFTFALHLLRGQNMQTAPTAVCAFQQKKILLKLDAEPTVQLSIPHFWGKGCILKIIAIYFLSKTKNT